MDHLQSAALGIWVGAGARSERDNEHGLSHLLEHMAFKGTRTRSAIDIAEEIEAVGGEVNAATSVETTSYYARILKDDVPLAVDILSDILRNSVFDPKELEREQHVIVQEIGAAHDTPDDRVYDLFTEAAYPGQPIGRTILGTPQTVRAAAAADAAGLPRPPLSRPRHGALRRRRRRPRPRSWSWRAKASATSPATTRRRRRRRVYRGGDLREAARPAGNADHRRVRGTPLLGRDLPHRAAAGRDPRRRHVVPPVPGSAREARALLLDLRFPLELLPTPACSASTPPPDRATSPN